MQVWQVVLAGSMGMTIMASADAPARGPEAHVIRQGKGDVLVIRDVDGSEHFAAPVKNLHYKPVRAATPTHKVRKRRNNAAGQTSDRR